MEILKIAEEARQETYQTRLEVVELRAELAACIKEVTRLVNYFDSGNGVKTQLVRVEDAAQATKAELAACQARCKFRVRLTVGIVSGLLSPVAIWGLIRIASHVFGN